MKANEIQIGDYFFVAKDNLCIRKGSVVEIRGINADDKLESKNLIGSAHCRPLDIFQFEGGIWLDYLEPIPLTPEILEENGFRECDKDDDGAIMYELGDEILGVSVWVNTEPCLLGSWRTWAGQSQSYSMIEELPISFVHELQHALRLCGIDKEIVI